MGINKSQLLLILAGVFIGIALYFAPRSEDKEQAKSNLFESEEKDQADLKNEDQDALTTKLEPEKKNILDSLEEKAVQIADLDTKLGLYDSLIQFSLKNNLPPLVGKYTEEKAKLVPTEKNWLLAGDRYFKAFRLSKNQSKEMIVKAIKAYKKVIELEPENLDAQTAIGVAYVEGAGILGEMPMKGIGILKEVLNKDPKNINALTNLGYFAIQSGQLDKAIERFNQVLSIEPENAEAYLYLTDAYLSKGDEEKGLETLETYKSFLDDPEVINQVDQYIEDIKNKK
mgnify:CR=1 FL=1